MKCIFNRIIYFLIFWCAFRLLRSNAAKCLRLPCAHARFVMFVNVSVIIPTLCALKKEYGAHHNVHNENTTKPAALIGERNN